MLLLLLLNIIMLISTSKEVVETIDKDEQWPDGRSVKSKEQVLTSSVLVKDTIVTVN
jgi:hypothetical protein